MKMSYKMFRCRTMTKKVALITIFIGTSIFLLANLILPNVFYASLKEYTFKPVSMMIDGAASKLSFILLANSDTLGKLKDDKMVAELLRQYYNQPEKRMEVLKEILDHKLIKFNFEGKEGYKINVSTAIISQNGDIFCKNERLNSIKILYSSNWYANYRRNAAKDGNRLYSPVFTSEDGKEYICYINTKIIDNQLFDFILIQDFNDFKKIFLSLESDDINDYLLLGAHNETLYSNLISSEASIDSIPKYMFEGNQFQVFSLNSKFGADFITRTSSQDEGLKVVVHASNSILVRPYKPIINFIKILLGIAFVLFIISMCIILNDSMKNLKFLKDQMLKVRSGDYDVRVNIKSADEIETLGDTFNIMMDEIRDYINKVIEHEKNERKMQYAILISEIDPHLIYNTLNTITYLARLKKTEDIVLVNNALICMLKDRLKIKGYESFDSMKNEMEVVNQYMIIQNYLHGNSIKLRWEVDDGMLEERIPKNIIQPLVENALFHGMMANTDENGEVIPGEIVVSLSKKEDGIHLSVKDSGIGMSDYKINEYFISSPDIQKNKGENIGIKNIRMRLKYLYAEKAKVKVNSEIGFGTSIEITLQGGSN